MSTEQGPPVYRGGYDDQHDESKMSALAVAGLACSLVCLIPLLPLVGAALGGAALMKINASRGRLTGVGMSLVAIVLGLAITAGQGMLAFGASRLYEMTTKFMGPMTIEVGSAVSQIAQGDYEKAKSHFTPESAAKITPEEFEQFRAALSANFGEHQKTVTDIAEAIRLVRGAPGLSGNQKISLGGGGGGGGGGGAQGGARPAMPALLVMSKGPAFVFAPFDPHKVRDEKGASGAASEQSPKIRLSIDDIIVFLPGRRAMTLREDGPGKQLALDYGMQPVYGAASLPTRGEASPPQAAPTDEPAPPEDKK